MFFDFKGKNCLSLICCVSPLPWFLLNRRPMKATSNNNHCWMQQLCLSDHSWSRPYMLDMLVRHLHTKSFVACPFLTSSWIAFKDFSYPPPVQSYSAAMPFQYFQISSFIGPQDYAIPVHSTKSLQAPSNAWPFSYLFPLPCHCNKNRLYSHMQ